MSENNDTIDIEGFPMRVPVYQTRDPNEELAEKVEDVQEDSVPILEESEDEESRQEEQAGERRPKKRAPLKRRLAELNQANRAYEAQNMQLMEALRQQEELLQQQQMELLNKDNAVNDYYDHALDAQIDSVKEALRKAKEHGDDDLEIELIERLSEFKSRKNQNQYHRNQVQPHLNREPQRYEPTYRQPAYYQAPEPYENEALQEFLEDHEFLLPQSSSFHPGLRSEVEGWNDDLIRKLHVNGMSHIVDTPEHYAMLSEIINSEHGVRDDDDYQERSPQQMSRNKKSAVAPVGRSGSTYSENYVLKNPSARGMVELTQDDYSLARSLKIPLDTGGYANEQQAIEIIKQRKARNSGPSITFKQAPWRG